MPPITLSPFWTALMVTKLCLKFSVIAEVLMKFQANFPPPFSSGGGGGGGSGNRSFCSSLVKLFENF
jgi:hypothetical protein